MKASRIAGAFATLLIAGAAHAQSFIPGNQVDDFGPFTYSNPSSPAPTLVATTHASIIPSNYIDDFGSLVSDRIAPEQLGAAGGEPGMDVMAAERAQEKAAIQAYNREQFLRSVWAPTP